MIRPAIIFIIAFALIVTTGMIATRGHARPQLIIPDIVTSVPHKPGYRFAPCPIEPWTEPQPEGVHQV